MLVGKKGWNSVCYCENLSLQLTNQKDLMDELDEEKKKYIFILQDEKEEFIIYETIRKTWININTIDEAEGLIQQRMPILQKISFEYYGIRNLIIFHKGINKVRNIIRYANNEFKSNIIIPKNINLKIFLHELEKSYIKYSLIEGMIIDHKLEGDSIGNFHFKNLTQKDYNDLLDQKSSYLSWIKLNIQGDFKNIDIILYLNGTFYQKKKDNILSAVFDKYFNLIR